MVPETETTRRNRRRGTCTEAICFVLILRAHERFDTLWNELGFPERNALATVILVAPVAPISPSHKANHVQDHHIQDLHTEARSLEIGPIVEEVPESL